MKDRALLRALVDCSAALDRAHRIARDAGRDYIAQLLRQAAWKIAAARDVVEVTDGVEEVAS